MYEQPTSNSPFPTKIENHSDSDDEIEMSKTNESLELENYNFTEDSKPTEKLDASLKDQENLCEGSGFCDDESTNDLDASDVASENDIRNETTNHTNDDKRFSKQAEIKSTEKSLPVTTEKINEPKNLASTIEPIKVEGSYSSTEFSQNVIRNSTMDSVVKQPASEGI